MNLIKITELSTELGLSSRTLRYYEEAGLITSVRPQFEKYRYYDDENIERIKQIMVLRKMQIPIKDIVKIFENEDMATLTQVFVSKINEIDNEVTALDELKNIINEFLKRMVENGIKKISALPLLYEEMDKQLEMLEEQKSVSFEDLNNINQRLTKPISHNIVSLPQIHMISSVLKNNPNQTDTDGFWWWVQENNIPFGISSRHEQFEYSSRENDVVMLKVFNDFENKSKFLDFTFDGGLFATANIYLDEDLGESFRSLVHSFDDNKFYEIDYSKGGELRHPAMLENLISPDEKRELVALFVPVKKRVANPALFDSPVEIKDIAIEEIEKQNPILWTKDVKLDKLIPIAQNGGYIHYEILPKGEISFSTYVGSSRHLSTGIKVKLPFRVDAEYRVNFESGTFGYGSREGALFIYHDGEFGFNTGNNADFSGEAIKFSQPIFHDEYVFPKRGAIKRDEYNKVTLIVGANHLAFFVNDELRYCGNNFPYMKLDLSHEEARPITFGSGGDAVKFLRKMTVSQLVYNKKPKIKKEEIQMVTKKSNNIIPIIHKLVTSEHGENYWFNGCAKYVMECLGEPDYDYSFFAGITGDNFTQHYKFNCPWDSASSYRSIYGDSKFFEDIFEKCGYAATYIFSRDLCKNKEMYLQTLIAFIDKGIPIISLGYGGPPCGVFVGYEEYGKTLLYISGDNNEPQRIPFDKAVESEMPDVNGIIFVGEKKEQKDLAKIYREAILVLPELLTTNDNKYCFGAAAFRKWADDIESGIFDNMKPEEFDSWSMYQNFVCVYATNGCCCHTFLEKAQALNSDMAFLSELSPLYWKTNQQLSQDMEALGGGFNVTLEALQDKDRRAKIAAKIREFAVVIDEVVRVLNEGINKTEGAK